MRRTNEEHTATPWKAHEFTDGFELLDVWRFPIRIAPEVPFSEFLTFLDESLRGLRSGRGPAALLFRLRGFLGRVFGWDAEPAAEGGARSLAFDPVFQSEHETLSEIENKTVHAFMHIGRVALAPESGEASVWSPQLAVYVKPRGIMGGAYMKLIGPFRHVIVYPEMMRTVQRGWPAYARAKGFPVERIS